MTVTRGATLIASCRDNEYVVSFLISHGSNIKDAASTHTLLPAQFANRIALIYLMFAIGWNIFMTPNF